MPIYALESLQLLNVTTTDNTKHAGHADNIICVVKLRNMWTWWNKSSTIGPKIGYFPKANKSWLIGKPKKHETTKVIFKDTHLNITNEGKWHLGTVFGTEELRKEYVISRVNKWVAKLKLVT